MTLGVQEFPLCGVRSKAEQVPSVLRGFADALADSRGNDFGNALGFLDAHDLYSLWRGLRQKTTYRNDPVCWDFAQTLSASMARQASEGFFGDCGAYAVAISALADELGLGVGEWLLLGDAEDPAKHIVNRFGDLVIDATQANGFDWQIPPELSVITVIDPLTGEGLAADHGGGADGVGFIDSLLEGAQIGASLVGAAQAGPAALGATVGGMVSNYALPLVGPISAALGLANKLIGGAANEQLATSIFQGVNKALGGPAGEFIGGLLAGSFALVDGALNLVGNIADKWLGFDASRWFGDHDDEICDVPTVTIEGQTYDGRGFDTYWLARGIGQRYIWTACGNPHDDIRFTQDITRHLPGVGTPFWGRDYTRGLLESKRYADGSYGWNGYASARANSRGDDWKDRFYYNNAYSTTDIYIKHLAAMRRVRVPVEGYIYETGGTYINTTGLDVLRVRDAVEKHADDLTYQDIAAMIALDALPAWLAIELASGAVVPKGTPTPADLSRVVTLGTANTYTSAPSAPSAASAASQNATPQNAQNLGTATASEGQPSGAGVGVLILLGLGLAIAGASK